MPIDYTIGRIEAPPQDQGFLSGLTKGVNLRNNMAISQTNVLKQQEYADEIKRGRELRNLISGAYQDKPDLNQGELGRMIMPFNYQEGYKLQAAQSAAKAAKAKEEKEHYDDTALFAANHLNNIRNPNDVKTFFANAEPLTQNGYLHSDSFRGIKDQILNSPDPVKASKMFAQSLIPLVKQQEFAIDRSLESGRNVRSAADRNAQMERLKYSETQQNDREKIKVQTALAKEQIKKDAFLKQLPPGVVKYHRGDQELTKDDVLAIKTQGPATTSFMKSVDQILDVIDKGGINVANPTGKQYAQLEALITDLGAQYRILKHLGVPNANDQALTESFIGEPTRLKSQFKQVKTKLETAKKLIYDGFNAEMDIRGFDPIPEPELTGGQSSSAAPAVKGEVVVKPNGDLVYDGFVLQKVVK